MSDSIVNSLRVIHLEDNPRDRELVALKLAVGGVRCQITHARTRAEFEAALVERKLDLVLCDFTVPSYGGSAALAAVRKLHPKVPFIFVSGTIGEERAVESLRSGATDYVLKDHLERLVPVVRRALREAAEREDRQQAERRIYELNLLLRAIREIHRLIAQGRDPERLLAEACHTLVQTRGYRFAWVGLVSPESKRVPATACAGEGADYLEAVPVTWDEAPTGQGPTGTTIRTRQPWTCQDTATDPRFAPWREAALARGFASVAATPMIRGECVLGAITVYSAQVDAFHVEELGLLHELAGDLAFALQSIEHEQERTRAEESLRENERRYRLLFNSGYDAVFVHQGGSTGDAPGKFIEVNDIACQRLGYTREELLQMTPQDISAPETLTDIPGIRAKLATDKSAVFGGVHLTKDGRRIPVEISTHVFELNGRSTRLSTVRDITERKRAELRIVAFANLGKKLSAARTAREAAEIILEVADHLLGWDACTLDLYSLEKDRLYHVLNRDTVNGQRVDFPPAFPDGPPSPRDRRTIEGGGQLVLKEGAPAPLPDAKAFGDTARPSASIMFVPVRDGAKVAGILSIHSYTPKAYDQQSLDTLQALADHCGGALDRITTEESLRTAQQQLRQSQKMEAVGQLAGGVAHDFNNMLAVIRGNADLLLLDAEQFDAEASQGLKQIILAAEKAANLSRQLLMFSRKQVMQSQPLELNDLIRNLAKMLACTIQEDIHLECLYADPLPFVQADPGMLEQVLLNLVVNARDAMPRGGHLQIATEKRTLGATNVQANPEARAGEFVCLSLSDTGTGIAPENLPRIFEPFFTTKEPDKGTGLGLATVYGIVKQHQGWIELSSKVGAGTRFNIFLPAIPAPVPTTVDCEAEARVRGGGEGILVVEDDFTVLAITQHLLEAHGYRVWKAASAQEALELWHVHAAEVSLLLTDLVMPGTLTGRELAERLQREDPGLKVILTSGYIREAGGGKTDFVSRLHAGYLPKPSASRTILEMVRRCLDAKEPAATPRKAGCAP